MIEEPLSEENFIEYAAKYYDNPQCTDIDEFYDDLKRFKYLKRLFGKYEDSGELKERLILNHLIILYNVFGPEATRMLFCKLDGYYHYLKPFIILLGFMPERVYNINGDGCCIISSDIALDQGIVNQLRKI